MCAWLFIKLPQNYGASAAIWSHKALPTTWQKRTRPVSTPAKQAGTWFTYTEGRKAELTLTAGYSPKWYICPQTVTNLSNNRTCRYSNFDDTPKSKIARQVITSKFGQMTGGWLHPWQLSYWPFTVLNIRINKFQYKINLSENTLCLMVNKDLQTYKCYIMVVSVSDCFSNWSYLLYASLIITVHGRERQYCF